MKIEISSIHWDLKSVFHISHEFVKWFENELKGILQNEQLTDKLILSISCISSNQEKVELGDFSKSRNLKSLAQNIYLPSKHILFESGYELNTRLFDFVYKDKLNKVYPLELYVKHSLTGLQLFLDKHHVRLNLLDHVNDILISLERNRNSFKYYNEDLLHLMELIDGTSWVFNSENGEEKELAVNWLNSEIGLKWLDLAKKYYFDSKGNLKKH
jgi:hypothetical protein